MRKLVFKSGPEALMRRQLLHILPVLARMCCQVREHIAVVLIFQSKRAKMDHVHWTWCRLRRSLLGWSTGPLDTVMPSEDLGQILVGQLDTGSLYALPASYYDFDLAGPDIKATAPSGSCFATDNGCDMPLLQVRVTLVWVECLSFS